MKRITAQAGTATALALSSGLAYAGLVEPKRLEITELAVAIHQLPPEFDGCRIVQFSDLHLDGLWTKRARVEQVVAAVNALQPDLIAFTGDFVTYGTAFKLEDLTEPLSQLHAADGVVAVMGNHDHLLNTGLIRRAIRESGMIDLNNAVYTLRRGDARLHIAGVDSLLRHHARLDLVMQQLPDDCPAILLAHEPQFADVSAATERFALQLSGHTHGGQIRLPLLEKIGVPGFYRRHALGVRRVRKMLLYVNRGIGMVRLPLRFNCPPEITVITLWAAAHWNIDYNARVSLKE